MSIVDSIMGGGKTTAALQKINRGYGLRFIYVTPFLPEVDRVLEKTRDFYQPKELGSGKLDSLHDLLCDGRNIVCTHALFLRATKETMKLIHHGKYILILDEALEILHEYNSVVPVNKQVNDKTVKWLIKTNSLKVDDCFNAFWNGDEEECTHNCSGCGHDCSAELAEELGIEPETPIIEKEEPDEENNNEEDM